MDRMRGVQDTLLEEFIQSAQPVDDRDLMASAMESVLKAQGEVYARTLSITGIFKVLTICAERDYDSSIEQYYKEKAVTKREIETQHPWVLHGRLKMAKQAIADREGMYEFNMTATSTAEITAKIDDTISKLETTYDLTRLPESMYSSSTISAQQLFSQVGEIGKYYKDKLHGVADLPAVALTNEEQSTLHDLAVAGSQAALDVTDDEEREPVPIPQEDSPFERVGKGMCIAIGLLCRPVALVNMLVLEAVKVAYVGGEELRTKLLKVGISAEAATSRISQALMREEIRDLEKAIDNLPTPLPGEPGEATHEAERSNTDIHVADQDDEVTLELDGWSPLKQLPPRMYTNCRLIGRRPRRHLGPLDLQPVCVENKYEPAKGESTWRLSANSSSCAQFSVTLSKGAHGGGPSEWTFTLLPKVLEERAAVWRFDLDQHGQTDLMRLSSRSFFQQRQDKCLFAHTNAFSAEGLTYKLNTNEFLDLGQCPDIRDKIAQQNTGTSPINVMCKLEEE